MDLQLEWKGYDLTANSARDSSEEFGYAYRPH